MHAQSSIAARPQRTGRAPVRARAIACFTLALGAGHAAAQGSVTLYGNVDGSVVASRNAAPGSRTVTSVASGVGSASYWGLRGSEDLGGGLKAVFQMEAGLDLDTGASKTYTGDYAGATPATPAGAPVSGFNRRASAGLETPYGTVLFGREYTPLFYLAVSTDTMRGAQYLGNVQALVSLVGGPERSARISNGIVYASPVMQGVRLRAAYGFGSESPGGGARPPRHANQSVGIGAEYVGGGLTVSGSLQALKLPLVAGTPAAWTGTTDRRDAALGARYVFGSHAVAAGHFRVGGPVRGSDTWLGGAVGLGAGTLFVQVQRLEQDNAAGAKRRATILGMTYAHALSKRTIAYASYGRTSNNATGQFGLSGNDVAFAAGAPGATPTALAIGLRHSF